MNFQELIDNNNDYQEEQNNNRDIFHLTPKNLNDTVLTIKNLHKNYYLSGSNEKVTALSSINLSEESEFYPIKKGEFVMIRGPSGGGKTTLLNIIGTLDSDFEGEVELLNIKITKQSPDSFLSSLRLKRIGFVFQTFNLISTMTALENVKLPMTIENILSNKERNKRAKDLLARVGLEDRMEHLPSELSGGEQQRVAIARALSNKPDVLLLDEPTGDLDSTSTIEVMNLLLSINRFGPDNNNNNPTTIIMVTHNPEIECYADRIIYIRDGVVEKQILNECQIALTPEEYITYINSNHV
jgi:putative ABC transport system ATP-binding protein